mgnify:CR=1 FL=1
MSIYGHTLVKSWQKHVDLEMFQIESSKTFQHSALKNLQTPDVGS